MSRYGLQLWKLALGNSDEAQGYKEPKSKHKGFELEEFGGVLYASELFDKN